MRKSKCVFSLVAGVLFVVCLSSLRALGQGSKPPEPLVRADRTNYEIHLQLLVAANEAGERTNLPRFLEQTIKQLKSSFSFTNYRLAATFVNRVKDGGTLESRGLIPSNVFTPANTSPAPQAFYEFTLTKIKADDDLVHIDISHLRFGLQIPVITGMVRGEGNAPATPLINYQPASINTEINIREGTPTIVGTLNTSRSDQVLILVITGKRAQ
jgi:hypothetical protein